MPGPIADSSLPNLDATAHRVALRRVFDRRAIGFDDVAFLPREIADRMMQRLDYIKVAPTQLLDAGCATGRDLLNFSTRYAQAHLTGVDVSPAMLAAARARIETAPATGAGRWLPQTLRRSFGPKRYDWIEAEFDAMPFEAERFDMLWSNLALQWHAAPHRVFPEWQRVLRVGGLLMFSTLGPDTLRELRTAWTVASEQMAGVVARRAAPMPDFVDMHDFGDMLVASGFELPVMDVERLRITYRDASALLADVHAWGTFTTPTKTNLTEQADATEPTDANDRTNAQGLRGRSWRAALIAALERQRDADGLLSLSFEVIYGHAWKAAPRLREAATVRVEDIGGRRARPAAGR